MATLEAARDKEYRHNKFMAALKGIDLDEGKKREAMERVIEEMQRLEAERDGVPVDKIKQDNNPFADMGLGFSEEG